MIYNFKIMVDTDEKLSKPEIEKLKYEINEVLEKREKFRSCAYFTSLEYQPKIKK